MLFVPTRLRRPLAALLGLAVLAAWSKTDGAGSEWEFGLRETEKGTWKIDRITPVRLPGGSPIFR